MYRKARFVALLMIFCLGPFSAATGDPSACLNCHAAEEFADLDVKAIAEALADAGIPPHKGFADLTEAEVKALLDALSQ